LAADRDFFMPSLEEMAEATTAQLVRMRRFVGGSYGFTLGHMHDGAYSRTRTKGRSTFAVASDAPTLHLAGHRSSHHGGRGQNVLFDDGHVEFITSVRTAFVDHLFLNHQGFVGPGFHENDAVIVASTLPLDLWRGD
jgi:hypothetical protein